jgi:hypothetical protein
MKRCRYCGEEKPLAEFYRDRSARDGHRPECKACTARKRRAWYEENRDREVARVQKWAAEHPKQYAATQERYKQSGAKAKSNRKSHLKRKYGLTLEQFDAMLAQQSGLCAICGDRPAAHVDHDHENGRVRALLCFNCNGALGHMLDNPGWLLRAIDYLEWHRAS